ncbi:hypothetical protein DFH29DRAFT_931310 [Suillus ampliporus]|nr:hypothetical protein DFH29DRAFT_931310 [Suillus ampliporus]
MASTELAFERSLYVGNSIATAIYGGNLFIYAYSTYLLMASRKVMQRRTFYICFGGFLLILLTISVASNLAMGDLMWIENRNIPGGPPAFLAANMAAWYNDFGTAADTAANILADGLLLYRCYIIWESRLQVIVIPAIIYLGSTAMGILMVVESAMPMSNIWQGLAAHFGIAWVALTVGFNIIVTALISARLLLLHRRIQFALTDKQRSVYTGTVAILVESALPFTVLGIIYLGTYIKGIPSATAVGIVWGTFVVLTPQLIILRIASGLAWSKDTSSQITETTLCLHQDLHSQSSNMIRKDPY